MQDKTINSALLALERDEGVQGNLARALLMLRGVNIPDIRQLRRLRRGSTRRMVLAALEGGPKTTSQIGKRIRVQHPDISKRSADNRAYQCLHKLREIAAVTHDGRVWALTGIQAHKAEARGADG